MARVSGADMTLPGECTAAGMVGAGFSGAITGGLAGIEGGPLGVIGGAVFGGAIGMAGAAFTCGFALHR